MLPKENAESEPHLLCVRPSLPAWKKTRKCILAFNFYYYCHFGLRGCLGYCFLFHMQISKYTLKTHFSSCGCRLLKMRFPVSWHGSLLELQPWRVRPFFPNCCPIWAYIWKHDIINVWAMMNILHINYFPQLGSVTRPLMWLQPWRVRHVAQRKCRIWASFTVC